MVILYLSYHLSCMLYFLHFYRTRRCTLLADRRCIVVCQLLAAAAAAAAAAAWLYISFVLLSLSDLLKVT